MDVFKKKKISQLLHKIMSEDTETITFVKQVESPCGSCTINPHTGQSTNPTCHECKGVGYKKTLDKKEVQATVEYGSSSLETVQELQGLLKEGQVNLMISIDELNDVGISWKQFLNEKKGFDYVLVDDVKYKILSSAPEKFYSEVLSVIVKGEILI